MKAISDWSPFSLYCSQQSTPFAKDRKSMLDTKQRISESLVAFKLQHDPLLFILLHVTKRQCLLVMASAYVSAACNCLD